MSSSQKEEPQESLIRLLDLKQKILFSSRDTDSELKYDPTLVHGMFVQCEYQDRNEDLPGNENYER